MRANRRIPVAEPALVGREREYVLDCLESTWISSNGPYLERFEAGFARYCGVGHGIACCNGTAALHAALVALGVGPGDEVIVPTFTFVAAANAVTYCGAKPVLVDSAPTTWTLDPDSIPGLVNDRTRGIVVVHLYGHPADLDPIMRVARERGLFVLEDAAEAHGAEYKGRRVGGFGDAACFSFYGNKVVTTGEGGMVVTDDPVLAERVRVIRGQGQDPGRRYWFPTLGYNYRMTNIAAAIGLAQLERIAWHVGRRREVATWYREELGGITALELSPDAPWASSVHWMSSAVLREGGATRRDRVIEDLGQAGVETRPFFHPLHTLPLYRDHAGKGCFPVAERLGASGLNLPSSARLTRADVSTVAAALRRALRRRGPRTQR